MVKVLFGNIFDSKAQTLVNTVNCIGVMGKGIALKFKERFPDMFNDYVERCNRSEVRLGKPYLFKRLTPPWILNFPTKGHWRSVSRIEDIVKGLIYLLQHYKEWEITSLAVPPLGCGQGQLEWKIVGPTLYRYLRQLDIPVELYAPYETPRDELQPEFLDQEIDIKPVEPGLPPERVKPAWVALVEILNRLEQEPYHWPVGHTTFQKIAYIATQESLPTGLLYQKSSFGPFSPELKGAITRLVNNGLIREEQLGRMFSVKVGSTFADARKAYKNELARWESIIEKTTDLFMRMQTKQSEVVATVLFAANMLVNRKKEQPSEKEVLNEGVMEWKQRRRPKLDDKEVAYTIRNLAALSWLKVKPSSDLPIPDETVAEG
jgi:O-acetyl-ADP-ribose deacetylase (regulator of RNase III)/uncharacterized protein YwgA